VNLIKGMGSCGGMDGLMNRFSKDRYDKMLMKQRRGLKKRTLGLVTNPHPKNDSLHKWS